MSFTLYSGDGMSETWYLTDLVLRLSSHLDGEKCIDVAAVCARM